VLYSKHYDGGLEMSVFAEKIKKLRVDKNLSTRMLAEELGVSFSMISKYENDVNEPTLSILRAYAKCFNVTLDYLCDDSIE
jgi:transcriptional regulator with XRE-family HTH domain